MVSRDHVRSRSRPKTLEGSETVLLVQDDEQVRAAARSILQRHGYTVIEAVGADDALAKCADDSLMIDLLLTDIVLPEVSGPELIQRAKRLSPKLKVLCISGSSADRVGTARRLSTPKWPCCRNRSRLRA